MKSHSCINILKQKNEEKDKIVSDQKTKIELLEKKVRDLEQNQHSRRGRIMVYRQINPGS